ncbi:MAG: RecB family exonuclease, partial [Flavobacteriales bacterium]
RCPLDFYFKYIAGIREPDVVDGKLGSDVLGDAVHKTLQRILTSMVGSDLDPRVLNTARERTTDLLSQELAEHVPIAALEQGHYRLRRDMAVKALDNHLEAEAERCKHEPTRLLAVELEVKALLSNGTMLKGRCDRIDLRTGRATVLDVKTGAVRDTDLRLGGLERAHIGPDNRYALQLLIYLWAYLRQHPDVPDARAGVIPLQRATQAAGEFLRISGEEVISQRDLPAIEAMLVGLVNELADPATPFAHDPDSTYCRMCLA